VAIFICGATDADYVRGQLGQQMILVQLEFTTWLRVTIAYATWQTYRPPSPQSVGGHVDSFESRRIGSLF
jgi:hypothetical protein